MSEDALNQRACSARLLPSSCAREGPARRAMAPRSLRSSVAAVCRRGCAEMTGTRARLQASLIRALNAWLLKGAPSRPGKINADPAKSTPPARSRTPPTETGHLHQAIFFARQRAPIAAV